jgi:hypothetical protein
MLTAFPGLTAETDKGRYTVVFGKKSVIYSERSGARDLAQIRELIAQVPAGHTALIVAPYADALRALFEKPAKFFFIAPLSFSEDIPIDERLIADDAALENFINSITAEEKFSVSAIAQWREVHSHIAVCTRRILERAAVRLKTIGHFARLWRINFRINAALALNYGDILELNNRPPDALVMAGPSLDAGFGDLKNCEAIWCADTAFPALIARGILPQAVFSVDAGFASREHFINLLDKIRETPFVLVCDILGNPAVQRLPFNKRLTYASSHPLVQKYAAVQRPDLTPIENPAGDVGSLMRAVHGKLFGAMPVKVFAHDGGHRRHVTHARGTAYFQRSYMVQSRLANIESYMLRLSRRYG